MATRSTNTQQEALQRILSDISGIKTMPDADLEFLVGLETNILGKLRQPFEQMQGQLPPGGMGSPAPGVPGAPGAGGMGGPPMPGGPGGGPMPVMPAPPGGGVPGVMSRPPLPNPDELRRLLGAGSSHGSRRPG